MKAREEKWVSEKPKQAHERMPFSVFRLKANVRVIKSYKLYIYIFPDVSNDAD